MSLEDHTYRAGHYVEIFLINNFASIGLNIGVNALHVIGLAVLKTLFI